MSAKTSTKPSTIYSTNPKMDTSGIQGKAPVYDRFGAVIGTKPVPGGVLYQKAISEQASSCGMGKVNALTSDANMRAAAKLVSRGYSLDHAFDLSGRGTMSMPDRVVIVKAVKKFSKG